MDTNQSLRLLVFGAGAIGTYIGGSLAMYGHQVVFVERPDVALFIAKKGMHITIAGNTSHVSHDSFEILPALEEAISLGPFDVSLFALKSFDTPTFITSLMVLGDQLSQLGSVLCLSNGVDNESKLSEALGTERVIAGTVTTAIGRRAAGDVVVEKLRGLGVAGGNSFSEQLVTAMSGAGLNAQLYSKAADMKWSKMLTNLLANATSAILNMTPAEIFADPHLCRLEVMQLREALQVMDKLNIGVVDLPHTPVRLLALGVRLPLFLSRPFLARAVGGGRGEKMPSFYIDLYGGRGRSEVEYLNGSVVRYGEKVGISTPVNRSLTEILLALTKKELPLTAYDHQPEKLLEEINK